jgi:O-acetyl-ADP-ribose deacetylase (regulator of RNase III)
LCSADKRVELYDDAEEGRQAMQKQRTYLIGKSRLSLEFGDITTSKADVLVSSDDAFLSMGGGVSTAILIAAGPQIRADTLKWVPAKLGDVIVSSAGALDAKYVFHAVTLGDGALSHEEIINKITHQCLSLLSILRLSSIAFPAIGSGIAGFTLETVASTMAEAIVRELFSSEAPLSVTIYLFDRFGRMKEIDYLQFFEEVAIRTRALNSTTPTRIDPLVAAESGAGGSVERVREAHLQGGRHVEVKKIFLASSSELREDRREFEIFVSRRNSSWVEKGIFLRVVTWEDFLDAMSKTRLQDEYNREVRDSHMFVMLFWTKVGPFTDEEFESAFGQFDKAGKPFVFTYFKTAPVSMDDEVKRSDLASLWKFQDKLKSLGHYQSKYANIDDLKVQLSQQLDKLCESGFTSFPL